MCGLGGMGLVNFAFPSGKAKRPTGNGVNIF